MIKAKLLAIFTYLVRYYQDEAKSSLTPAQKNKRLEQLQVVFEHIGRNLDQSLLLEDLAALVYMTPSYFCTFFKRATGQTPVQYIHKVRVAGRSTSCARPIKGSMTLRSTVVLPTWPISTGSSSV